MQGRTQLPICKWFPHCHTTTASNVVHFGLIFYSLFKMFQPKSVKATPTTTTNNTTRRSAPRYTPRRGILEESDSDSETANKSIRSRHALKRGTKEVNCQTFRVQCVLPNCVKT